MAFRPRAGIIKAPKPKSSTRGATFVISPGTRELMVPNIDAALDTADWRGWVLVDLLDELGESASIDCSNRRLVIR